MFASKIVSQPFSLVHLTKQVAWKSRGLSNGARFSSFKFIPVNAMTSTSISSSSTSISSMVPSHQQQPLKSMLTSRRLFSSDKTTPAEVNTSFTGRFKTMWKKYGYIAIGTYFGIYASTLGSLFFVLDFGILNASSVGFDPVETIHKFCDIVGSVTGTEFLPGFIKEHPNVGHLAIAWVMTKFTEPLRLGITLAIVPKIAKILGQRHQEHDSHDHDKSK